MLQTLRSFVVWTFLLAAAGPLRGEWQSNIQDISIPLRDGKSLNADVYLPATEGNYPAVLIQTPYNKAFLRGILGEGKGRGGEVGRGAESDLAVLRDREHYAYVVVDWRGFFASKEAADGARKPIRRGLDGYDCVEWIARQPWSNGKVGTWGGSALGRIQFETAAEKPPHLVCAVPLIAPLGQRYEDYYDGGILREAHVNTLDRLGFGVSAIVKQVPNPDALAWTLAKRATYKPESIEVPCLVITGWWDHHPASILSSWEDIRAKGGPQARQSKLLVGPWDHVSIGVAKQGDLSFPKAAKASGEAARAFLDYWLRGSDNGWYKAPDSRLWQIGEEQWIEDTP
ncbi:MAG: CocE/NonD family hydrolase, partial [Planctomycetes bacterium]|nr:CocE/NonD family hydrolase [Planctomycetota bacterium]